MHYCGMSEFSILPKGMYQSRRDIQGKGDIKCPNAETVSDTSRQMKNRNDVGGPKSVYERNSRNKHRLLNIFNRSCAAPEFRLMTSKMNMFKRYKFGKDE